MEKNVQSTKQAILAKSLAMGKFSVCVASEFEKGVQLCKQSESLTE